MHLHFRLMYGLSWTDFEHKASDSPQSDLAQIEHPVLLPLLCTPSLQVTPIPCVQWVGLTLQHFSLGPGETRVLELEARVPRPGMYSFNNLLLKACLESSGPLDFVRQNTVPSSIILVDHETDTT
ncbi:hypothetical protein AHF37_11383 [Paragonimus kellicotti]|nr:hypothetical protein AHF37_11383 [Paragonimus kellicotti]